VLTCPLSAVRQSRLDPAELIGGLCHDQPQGEGAAREALSIGAVARVDQLRSFGDLVANVAPASAALGKFHRDLLFTWPLLIPISPAPLIFVDDICQRNTANRPEPAHRIADRKQRIAVYVRRRRTGTA
jgi:hypothetical protein